MQLADLIRRLRAITIDGPLNREIRGISYDSRRAVPGHLFVAIRGERFDGHSFVEEAIKKEFWQSLRNVPAFLIGLQ